MNLGGTYSKALSAWDSYLGSQRQVSSIIGQTWLNEAKSKQKLGEITQTSGLFSDLVGLGAELIPADEMWGGEKATWDAKDLLKTGFQKIKDFRFGKVGT